MIELDRKIGHKSVMSIWKFFIDRDDPDHLVDQAIHNMKVTIDAIAEGDNGMDQFYTAALSFDGAAPIWVSVYMCFIHG